MNYNRNMSLKGFLVCLLVLAASSYSNANAPICVKTFKMPLANSFVEGLQEFTGEYKGGSFGEVFKLSYNEKLEQFSIVFNNYSNPIPKFQRTYKLPLRRGIRTLGFKLIEESSDLTVKFGGKEFELNGKVLMAPLKILGREGAGIIFSKDKMIINIKQAPFTGRFESEGLLQSGLSFIGLKRRKDLGIVNRFHDATGAVIVISKDAETGERKILVYSETVSISKDNSGYYNLTTKTISRDQEMKVEEFTSQFE